MAAVVVLPPKQVVLEACRGLPPEDHVVLTCACRLTELHERRLSTAQTWDIDRLRAELVHEIDRWVTEELPAAEPDARLHTETVGTVIDRLAQFSALAYLSLTQSPESAILDAWRRLSELAVAYDDLAAELTSGRCRLPYLGHHEYEH
ncbi:hypothetical protein AWN90_41410 [Nocardia terpenica]|uniref:DUF4254 domain-containing protein n=1 Tax=Nocardia terpenica TaxID=455432 RepID=A0A164K397_9NOCA|nr:hypothetical protein AWN90_41410 [Nocardia terpenica]